MPTITEYNLNTGELTTRELTPQEIAEIPSPTKANTLAIITREIGSILDQGAKAWGYDSIVSAASYSSSTNFQYAADARALVEWRDAVWGWAIPLFDSVVAGQDTTAFLANIPQQPPQPVVE
jgi:hypothetical protein